MCHRIRCRVDAGSWVVHRWFRVRRLTDIDGAALLCSRCHHDLHHGRYTITTNPDGVPEITTTPRAPPVTTAAA